MRRYCRIIRKKKYHVGVYDRKINKVLHLVHKNGLAQYKIQSKYIFDPEKKGTYENYENIKHSDFEIKGIWNLIEKGEFQVIQDNKDITYFYDFSGLRGVNCESIVEYVLNGEFNEPRGNLAKPLTFFRIVGRQGKLFNIIDLGSSNSNS